MEGKSIEPDERWDYIQQGITKLKGILEGGDGQFSTEESMSLYTAIYNICDHHDTDDLLYNPQLNRRLYDKYRETIEEYISSTVLPSITEKHVDELMLRELVKRWANHKLMVRQLSWFFDYLERYFVPWNLLPPLKEVGLDCFRTLVYSVVNEKARNAVIALIDKERNGELIDRALLKNVLDIFVEIGMDFYERDFEKPMLEGTCLYYRQKASCWIQEDSCPAYMLKAEECLQKERERVAHYMHSSSEAKIVEKVQDELLVNFSTLLLGKEDSGCRALLRDDKVEDLSRMYGLYHEIPKGLDPVATIFKQHITAEGTALVQQLAEDAAANQVLILKVTELRDKYLAYVRDCFQNHMLFGKAMKEAFEILYDKPAGGSRAAELLATFCDNIIVEQGGGSEKVGDDEEAIEEIHEHPEVFRSPTPKGTIKKRVVHLSKARVADLRAEYVRRLKAKGSLTPEVVCSPSPRGRVVHPSKARVAEAHAEYVRQLKAKGMVGVTRFEFERDVLLRRPI